MVTQFEVTFNLETNSEGFLLSIKWGSYILYPEYCILYTLYNPAAVGTCRPDLRCSELTMKDCLPQTCNTTRNFHQPGLP